MEKIEYPNKEYEFKKLKLLANRAKKMSFKEWGYSNIEYPDIEIIKNKYGSLQNFYNQAKLN
jgi:hypothetical protein